MSLSVHHLLPGDRVEIREILNERIWTVRPVTVIEDSEDQFVSYLATGTLIDYPVDVEHGEKCFTMWLTGKWELVQKEFSASGMLRTTPRSVPFEVFTTVLPNGGVASWYVKCREPLCRRPHGLDALDETLDLIASRDLSVWQRRDQDELEMAAATSLYSSEDVERLLASCPSVEEQLASRKVPWYLSWLESRPRAIGMGTCSRICRLSFFTS